MTTESKRQSTNAPKSNSLTEQESTRPTSALANTTSRALNLTDVIVECTHGSDSNGDAFVDAVSIIPTGLEDKIFNSPLKPVSPTRWEYMGHVAMPPNITELMIIAQSETSGDVGYLSLTNDELVEWIDTNKRLSRNFDNEGENPQLMMSFRVSTAAPHELDDGDHNDQPLRKAIAAADHVANGLDILFAELSIPRHSQTPEIPALLNSCGRRFLQRYLGGGQKEDLDKSIGTYALAVDYLPAGDARLRDYMHNTASAYLKRYTITGQLSDIQQATSMLEITVDGAEDDHPDLPGRLDDLSTCYTSRFQRTSDLKDNSAAISTQQKLIQLLPETSPNLARHLVALGNSFMERFEHFGKPADLTDAIFAQQKAIQLTPNDDPRLPGWISTLGNSLMSRFQFAGNNEDISNAISAHQRAVKLTTDGDPQLPGWLNNLGNSFQARFQFHGNLPDIEEAISAHMRAVQLIPDGHSNLPLVLNNLGKSYLHRFEHTGLPSDISEAINSQRKAVHLTPHDHPNKPHMLNNLGISLASRFEERGSPSDISESISILLKSVRLTPQDHTALPDYLTNLGASYEFQFRQSGNITDISNAISAHRKAIQISGGDHLHMATMLSSLGVSLTKRFNYTGNISDISEAIEIQERALHIIPSGHRELSMILTNFGNSYSSRFNHTGDLADISEAISAGRRSVQVTSDGHAKLPLCLSGLATSLQSRFQYSDDPSDIVDAIAALRRAVELTPEGHGQMAQYLNNLSITLQCSISHGVGDSHCVNEAVDTIQKAVELTSENDPGFPERLSNLGVAYGLRFKCSRDVHDINDAISIFRRAVNVAPVGQVSMRRYLSNLGSSLQLRFENTSEPTDIADAISALQNAIDITPEEHPSLTIILRALGNSFLQRFTVTQDVADSLAALSSFRQSATTRFGAPSVRLTGATLWAKNSRKYDRRQAMEACDVMVDLISQVAGMENTIQRRHTSLGQISHLGGKAASLACSQGDFGKALEWLEQARCLVWNQINKLRTPLDNLRSQDPALADRFLQASKALEASGSRQDLSEMGNIPEAPQKIAVEVEAAKHVKIAQEWELHLKEIRTIPQFHDFLRSPQASDLLERLPDGGPVIIINVTQERCDALALISGSDAPLHVYLREFTFERALQLRDRMRTNLLSHGIRMRDAHIGVESRVPDHENSSIREILGELWTRIVVPIFEALALNRPTENPLRIWWCLTGPLAFLPLHAAGIYSDDPEQRGPCVADFAVSSYTPNVSALVEKIQTSTEVDRAPSKILLISQPNTPGLGRLPSVKREVQAIRNRTKACSFHGKHITAENATTTRVKEELPSYDWVHLACHAVQDTATPLKSGFYLHNERLELAEIMKQQIANADLAFLSACQTSAGDEKLSEEAVHLAAGMLAAGYRGVIATMWSIQDDYGPDVADDFYGYLLQRRGDDESRSYGSARAAKALHHTVKRLRERLGDSEMALMTRAPYVHFGI